MTIFADPEYSIGSAYFDMHEQFHFHAQLS